MIINGTDLLLYFSTDDGATWEALAHATSHSLNYDMSTRDTSHKKSGTAKTIAVNPTTMTGSADGLVSYVEGCDYHTLLSYIKDQRLIKFASAQDDTDDPDSDNRIIGDIYLTNVSITSSNDENVVYGIAFKSAEDITHTYTNNVVETDFSFATASADLSQSYLVRLPVGKTLTVDWGDGTEDSYAGNNDSDVDVTHTYAGAGSYDIKFKDDYLSLTDLRCDYNSLTGDISSWSVLTGITYINCNNNLLTGDISGWSALTNLTELYCYANSLTGDVSSWSALTELTILYCQNNSLTGDVSSWSALTNLAFLRGYNNSLDFDSVTSWAALDLGTNCQLQDNSMSSTQVDNALNSFANGPFLNTTINLSSNAVRTSASDAAVTTLVTNGCTVITNGLTEPVE